MATNPVTYDRHSYVINGERMFVNSASIHYFRMPKEEWRDVLMKAKMAGMNVIDTYFAWNVHEPEEGQWDFSGDNDCGAFIDLCAELDLLVMARPGPFICAEWDFGGFPWWLQEREPMTYRSLDANFLKYVDRYFDKLIPILRERQISKGGNVILVQVENEYGYLYDDETAHDYMVYLRDGMINRGIDVPLITCVGGVEGTIEGANFWSNADEHFEKLVTKQPNYPKIVTEFWTGWFEHWGAPAATHKTANLYERRMMETLQAGFTGISHYMFYGGTNFGSYGGRTIANSDIFMVTSYDYDATLSEYGRSNEKYAAAKTISLFSLAMQKMLLEADPITTHDVKLSKNCSIRGRQNGEQKLWFVESLKEERETFHVTLSSGRTIPITVKPGQIMPLVDRLNVWDGLQFTTNTFISGNEEMDGVHTIIISHDRGQRSFVQLEANEAMTIQEQLTLRHKVSADGRSVQFDFHHFEQPQVVHITVGGKTLRLVVINADVAEHTWRIDKGQYAIGYEEVEIRPDGSLYGVRTLTNIKPMLLGFGKADLLADAFVAEPFSLDYPTFNNWTTETLSFDQIEKTKVEEAVTFSKCGHPFGYLLYEYSIPNEQAAASEIILPALGDTARVYLNGVEQLLITQVGAASIPVQLASGDNKLQILIQHMGSLNFSPFQGEVKGLSGAIYRDGATIDMRSNWQLPAELGAATVQLDEVVDIAESTLLTRTFTKDSAFNKAVIVGGIGGTLIINGKTVEMPRYEEWFHYHVVDISDYLVDGENTITMSIFKTPLYRLDIHLYHTDHALTEVTMTPIATPQQINNTLAVNDTSSVSPTWFRTTFAKPAIAANCKPGFKLRLNGLSKGRLLLNGIDLGRYWQVGPQEDYKVPVSWLRDENELILFDETGKQPTAIQFVYDRQSTNVWGEIK
ncbi:beta-galactosidase [Paenibacillus yanchengensis]|uniref:Beta-galactosidase n=1 Tax=Paenibacillus yanchengensis TaxID=2035833 RepID=A0ABW4YFU2_9BACL